MNISSIELSDYKTILKLYQNHDKFPCKHQDSYTWSEPIDLDYEKILKNDSIDPERSFNWSEPIDLKCGEVVEFPNIEW